MTETFEGLASAVAAGVRTLFAAGELWRAVELGERGLHVLALAPVASAAGVDAALEFGRISAVANFQGDGAFARTIGLAAKAADDARRLGDGAREAAAHDVAGLAHYYADMMTLTETYAEATACFERAERLLEPAAPGLAAVLFHRGLVQERLGRYQEAEALFERAEDLAGTDALILSYALRHLAFAAHRRGDLDAALAGAERSLSLRRGLGLRPYLPLTLLAVADIRLARGERDEALDLYDEALAQADDMRLPCGQVFALLSHLAVAKGDGDIERATALADEAEAVAGRVGYPRWIKAIQRMRQDLG